MRGFADILDRGSCCSSRRMLKSSCVLLGVLFIACDVNGFGFSPVLNLRKENRFASLCQHRQSPLAAVMMARPGDGGASKINKGGSGGNVGGKGGPDFSKDQEGGGAGVAVLTKPPDLDKVGEEEEEGERWPGY